MRPEPHPTWPVLTRYDKEHLARIALPLGGIGTGTVSLGGRGDLRDWEIVNRPAKGYTPRHSFFAVFARPRDGVAGTRLLEGPLAPPFDDSAGFRGQWSGMPRFREAEFLAAYPFGQVLLSDDDMPISVRIEAFNPLVPCDLDASGLPVAVLRFAVKNVLDRPVTAAVCGNLNNFIGTDGSTGFPSKNENAYREDDGMRGLSMSSKGVRRGTERYGTMALVTTAKAGVSHRTGWYDTGLLFESLRDFWDDFSTDGTVTTRDDGGIDDPVGSLAVRFTLQPQAERTITFVLAWSFPNRMTWTPADSRETAEAGLPDHPFASERDPNLVGNYYSTQHKSAWHAAGSVVSSLRDLETRTLDFVRTFLDADLPGVIKEAALYNVSTLRTQTCFRTRDGRFYGWEGCSNQRGCCHGSCTHVWNYEQTTAFLFGELALSMREVELAHATDDDGMMSFRVHLPLARAQEYRLPAADGQMGCIMKLYRDWQLSGDDELLRRLFPAARRALRFAWIPGGWDADRDGVMEGIQHNTTDLEFYGPNPLTAGWYLGALRAAEEMAAYLGDEDFATDCRMLYDRGSAWIDENLFNGEYYEQQIRPSLSPDDIAANLIGHAYMRGEDVSDPPQQPGKGCMTDQLVGQFMANVCGLGHLLRPRNITTTLRSIMKHNFLTDLYSHANPVRAFALQDESMLVYGTYPHGDPPPRSCFRFPENWTGVEYAAAILMMQEGRVRDGLRVFEAVRSRFDGRKRNPFNEPECGHHYARAMAAWAAIPALTGFRYSGVHRSFRLGAASKEQRGFWSTGFAWGSFVQKPTKRQIRLEIEILHGSIEVKTIELSGAGTLELPRSRVLTARRTVSFVIPL